MANKVDTHVVVRRPIKAINLREVKAVVNKVDTHVVDHRLIKAINLRNQVVVEVVAPNMVRHGLAKATLIAHVGPITILKKKINNNHDEQAWK